jgi:hypothetical protein
MDLHPSYAERKKAERRQRLAEKAEKYRLERREFSVF